jgi:hypothetical protein
MTDNVEKKKDEQLVSPPMGPIGWSGLKESSGFVREEFLPELSGQRGIQIYREMSTNDPTVGALLFSIEQKLKSVEWKVQPHHNGNHLPPTADQIFYKDLVEGMLFRDMEVTWDEFIVQALSMIPYGWSLFEIVAKRRMGPYMKSKQNKSLYSDGLIGVRSLSFRPQDTLYKWEFDENDDSLKAFIQRCKPEDPKAEGEHRIPVDKFLLFNARRLKNSPEGVSALRSAYRPWYFKTNIEQIEAIGIERDLAGLPVILMPSKWMTDAANGDANAQATVASFEATVRDLRMNSQAGVILPSDVFGNADGTLTNIRQVEMKLLASNGNHNIDMEQVIQRFDLSIARTMLADFLMLGSNDRGSYALSQSKADFFQSGLRGWLDSIAKIINRDLIPAIWQWNGFDFENMPYVEPGDIAPYNIETIGKFIKDLSSAGFPLFPNDVLENELLREAGLPTREPTKEDL